jgi:hypothetical protein
MNSSLVYMFGRAVRMGAPLESSESSNDWLINPKVNYVVPIVGVFIRVSF